MDETVPYQIWRIWPSVPSKNGVPALDQVFTPPPETDDTSSGQLSLITVSTRRSPVLCGETDRLDNVGPPRYPVRMTGGPTAEMTADDVATARTVEPPAAQAVAVLVAGAEVSVRTAVVVVGAAVVGADAVSAAVVTTAAVGVAVAGAASTEAVCAPRASNREIVAPS